MANRLKTRDDPLVVSTVGPNGFNEYGRAFLDTFAMYWPQDVDLVMYVEDRQQHPRAEIRDLNKVKPCRDFLARHANHPSACGRAYEPCWKRSEQQIGYSFRTDAVKFCHKVFALADAARLAARKGRTVVVWIDADVATFKPVPRDFIDEVLGDADVAFLGRAPAHSECGFMAFRLPRALPLINELERLYATDEVFELPQWHDSYVFDVVRHRFGSAIAQRDLTPGGEGHVWVDSILGDFMDHKKGQRKELGYSPERIRAPYRSTPE